MKRCLNQSSDKTKLVFIDWDGTLSSGRLWSSIRDESSEHYPTGKRIEKFLFQTKRGKAYLRRWMKGKVSSEDVNLFLSEKYNIEYEWLWETFKKDCAQMPVYEESLNAILELRRHSYVTLITGNMDCFSRFTKSSLKLDNYFDEIVNSSDVGVLKTEHRGREFKRLANKYDVPIENSFLIDDSKHVCDVFSSLGGKACKVSTRDDTRNELSTLMQLCAR